MTRLATPPSFLGILVSGTVAAALAAGCGSNKVTIGLQNVDAQVSGLDATRGNDASAAGSGGNGGVTGSGGVTATGGSTRTGGTTVGGLGGSGGAGGSSKITTSGGTTGNGGVNASGGTTGTGGSTACASGWTLCCGQCLSPLQGVCAPCSSGGGAGSTGGTPGTGGTTRTGGTTASGGTPGTGGTSGATCGGLRGMSCSPGQFCDLLAGSCNVADAMGTCVVNTGVACPAIYQPVCSCDGNTYNNDCLRQAAGVSKKADGACAAGVCPAGKMWCPGCTPGTGTCLAMCGAVACPPPDSGTGDAGTGVACSDDGGVGLAAVARQCTQDSDCTILTAATCCGADSARGVAKAQASAYSACFALPPGACSGLACPTYFGYVTDTGKTTPFEGTTVQPIDLVSVGCVGHLCTTDVVLPPADAGAISPTCPSTPPTNASSCGSTNMTCFYDNCPSTGRTQANCAGGAWTVQTAACGTLNCISRTCPSGQMCLVTEGGAVGVQCVDNSCGHGPVTPECGTTIGNCVVNATLTSGVTITCNTCPQGGCP
jgi:Kazal-type serine protease inhibitor domain